MTPPLGPFLLSALALLVPAPLVVAGEGEASSPSGDARTEAHVASRYARLALDCIHREYPNKVAHVLNGDADALPPRKLTPAFYGCYDWHSSVHAHWLLARVARLHPSDPLAAKAREALGRSLTAENIRGEVTYLNGKGRATFERPYGLAWLLQLSEELREWDDHEAQVWWATLRPLAQAAAARLFEWIPKLSWPIREGEHAQTAFAFGLVLDWARGAGEKEKAELLTRRVLDLYARDAGCPLAYEPSGQDFLSPCLGEADLMRRVMPRERFAAWLGAFLPQIPADGSTGWLKPAVTTDASDGKLAHLDGLNLSRAWMLDGIASGLPEGDPRIRALSGAARAHREAGLEAITGQHYEGGHWLGTFAVYALTGRGLPGGR